MKTVADMINNRDPTVHGDPELSMLMLAEVQSHVPKLKSAAPPQIPIPSVVILLLGTIIHLLLAS